MTATVAAPEIETADDALFQFGLNLDSLTRRKLMFVRDASPDAFAFLVEGIEAEQANNGKREQIRTTMDKERGELQDAQRDLGQLDRVYKFTATKITKQMDADFARLQKTIARINTRNRQFQKELNQPFFSTRGMALNALIKADATRLDVHDTKAPIAPGETALGNFQATMEKIKLAESTRDAVNKSLPALDDLLLAATLDIEARAEVNPPNFKPMMNRRKRGLSKIPTLGDIIWPIDYAAQARHEENQMDHTGLIFWAFRDQIKLAAHREIKRLYDPKRSMSDGDRIERVNEIDAEIRELEYVAGAYARQAHDLRATFRVYENPLAILGLKAD